MSVFSNRLNEAPISAEALQEAIRKLEQLQEQGWVSAGAPPSMVPSWVWEMATEEGWIDEAGNLTPAYWKAMREEA